MAQSTEAYLEQARQRQLAEAHIQRRQQIRMQQQLMEAQRQAEFLASITTGARFASFDNDHDVEMVTAESQLTAQFNQFNLQNSFNPAVNVFQSVPTPTTIPAAPSVFDYPVTDGNANLNVGASAAYAGAGAGAGAGAAAATTRHPLSELASRLNSIRLSFETGVNRPLSDEFDTDDDMSDEEALENAAPSRRLNLKIRELDAIRREQQEASALQQQQAVTQLVEVAPPHLRRKLF